MEYDTDIDPDGEGQMRSDSAVGDETYNGEVQPALKRTHKTKSPLFVYFIQCATPPLMPVKIGYARDPTTRLSNLQSGNPFRLTLIGHAPVAEAETVERQLHARFGRVRLRGEWFVGIPELVQLAQRVARYQGGLFHAAMAGVPLRQPAELAVIETREGHEALWEESAQIAVPRSMRTAFESERERIRLEWEAREAQRVREMRDCIEHATSTPAPAPKQRIVEAAERIFGPRLKPGQFVWRGKTRTP